MTKEYFITNSRFKYIALMLFLIFLILMLFLFMYADTVKKNPCAVCADKMGENVVCSTNNGFTILTRTFSMNGSVYDNKIG